MSTTPHTRPNPYVGPRAFERGETLYGRDREVMDLLDLLIAERIVMLYSPSGAGKSSLIQAALIPRLEAEGFQVFPVMRVSHEPPPGSVLPPTTNRYILSAMLSLEESVPEAQQIPLDELARLDLDSYLERRNSKLGESDNVVLIFDPFEEILTIEPINQEAKMEFFAQVGAALRDRQRWALFALREEYIAGLDPFTRAIPTRLQTTFRLDLLEKDAACDAVQKPADDAGVVFSDPAAAKLVNDLCQVQVQQADGTIIRQQGIYVEPVQLQVVCRRLWEKLPDSARRIEEADVETVGDVDNALADYYADRVRAIAADTGVSERVIRDWCDNQLITDQGIRGQVLHSPGKSQGLENPAVLALVDTHLVRADKRRGVTWYELAHDRLVQPVRENNAAWREANLSALQQQAALWDKQSRPDGLLLRDEALAEAEGWAEADPDILTSIENDFLNRCREIRDIARRERQRRRARRVRWLAIGATIISIIAIVAAISAFYQRNIAVEAEQSARTQTEIAETEKKRALEAQDAEKRQREEADKQRTIAEEKRKEAEEATQRALEAQDAEKQQREEADKQRKIAEEKRKEAEEATQKALKAQIEEKLQRQKADAARAQADRQAEIAISRQLAAQAIANLRKDLELSILLASKAWEIASADNSIAGIVGIEDAKREVETVLRQTIQESIIRHTFKAHAGPVSGIAFSPDGQLIATAGDHGALILWDPVSAENRILLQDKENIQHIVFSPDGARIATEFADGTVSVWDVNTGQEQFGSRSQIIFNKNGICFVNVTQDGRVTLWDVESGDESQSFSIHDSQFSLAAFSPDGEYLAVGLEEGIVRVWDFRASQEKMQLRVHTHPVRSIAFSHDSKYMATVDQEGIVKVWDIASRQRIMTLIGSDVPASSIAFNPTGSRLAVGYKDGTVMLWDVTPGARKDINARIETLNGDRLVQIAVSRCMREFTDRERQEYLGKLEGDNPE